MSISVHLYVQAYRTRGQGMCQTADRVAANCGVPESDAAATLDALATEGVLTRRTWIHCPSCDAAVALVDYTPSLHSPDDDPVLRAVRSCPGCGEYPKDPVLVHTYWLYGSVSHVTDAQEVLPGPDLDLAVAESMGKVPCSAWTAGSMGSMMGPALFNAGCYHESGACYPTTKGWADGLGGTPPYSTRRDRHDSLTLADLPPDTTLRRDAGGTWWVRVPGKPEIHGSTEPHVMALAFLTAGQPPRWAEENRWRSTWLDKAVEYGLVPARPSSPGDLPSPWTPQVVLMLNDVAGQIRDNTSIVMRRELEKSNPKNQRTIICDRSGMGNGDPLALWGMIHAASHSCGRGSPAFFACKATVLRVLNDAVEAGCTEAVAAFEAEAPWRAKR